MKINFDLSLVQPRRQARLSPGEQGGFVLSDGSGSGLQIVDLPHPDLARSLLRLQVELLPLEGGTAEFCLLRPTRQEIIRVARDGTVTAGADGEVVEATCSQDASGWWQLDIRFRNFAPALLFGLGRPGPRFEGSGTAQFGLRNLSIEVLEPRWKPAPEDRLIVLDTGPAPEPDPTWAPYQAALRMILCHPDPAFGQAALAALPAEGNHILLEHALSVRPGPAKFNITRRPALSSVLDPDLRRLKPFASARSFTVTNAIKVQTSRFDALSRQMNLPQPDLLRVKAGGTEYDALRGCGTILDAALAAEVQVYFYPLYRRQKLIGDIIELMEGSGFALRKLVPDRPGTSAHEVVTGTAYFTRRNVEGPALGKVGFIEEIWGVSFPR